MNLNQIKSFMAVTQTLNFTRAARQNNVPPVYDKPADKRS